MEYQLLTDSLVESIAADVDHHGDWLILSESQEFPGYWQVDCLDDDFFYDFEDTLGRYRLVSPARINVFLEQADGLQYRVVWGEDPEHILQAFESLRAEPSVSLNSTLEGNVKGFLPWQIIGFNKFLQLERDEVPAMLAVWDTGAGKTALEAAAIRHYLDQGAIDLALVVVKAHNKIDTQRKLKSLGDVDSIVIEGDATVKRKGEILPGPRFKAYEEISDRLKAGEQVVMVTNYESFRSDRGIYDNLLKKRRVLCCWDEMPTRLSNRSTQLYSSVKQALYKSFISKPNPSWMRHLVLSATPIEKDPDGLYSYLNLVRPYFLGTVTEFQAAHVTHRNMRREPDAWGDLDKVEAKLDHMTHRVSKEDPDVAKMFPKVIPNEQIIDWHPGHRAIYDRFTGLAEDLLKEEGSGVNALSLIQVLQMLCDAPSMVKASASNRAAFSALMDSWGDLEQGDLSMSLPMGSQAALELVKYLPEAKLVDKGHTKLEAWKEIILEKHPTSKIVTHSTWASYIFPVWHRFLDEWGVSYVTYAGTDKQKQMALDDFRQDPDIRVFLSGDAGADSIDIAEAEVGVNYNGPWKWTTEKQREGRRDRVNSTFKTIYTYTLMMAASVEDRKREVRLTKYGHHAAIFEGRANESALSARLTPDDLRYMLFGDPEE